jgi:hypothetical protein
MTMGGPPAYEFSSIQKTPQFMRPACYKMLHWVSDLAYIVPRRIYACRKQEGTANWRKRCNEELHNISPLPIFSGQ